MNKLYIRSSLDNVRSPHLNTPVESNVDVSFCYNFPDNNCQQEIQSQKVSENITVLILPN